MNPYCIKCSKLTNDNDIKVEHEIDGKINLYSHCIDCWFGFIDEEEVMIYWKFHSINKTVLSYCLKCKKKRQK